MKFTLNKGQRLIATTRDEGWMFRAAAAIAFTPISDNQTGDEETRIVELPDNRRVILLSVPDDVDRLEVSTIVLMSRGNPEDRAAQCQINIYRTTGGKPSPSNPLMENCWEGGKDEVLVSGTVHDSARILIDFCSEGEFSILGEDLMDYELPPVRTLAEYCEATCQTREEIEPEYARLTSYMR